MVVKVCTFDFSNSKKNQELTYIISVSFGLMGADISKIFEELRVNGVVCDFREPNSIRTAAVPLYNTFEDVFNFVTLLKNIYDTCDE